MRRTVVAAAIAVVCAIVTIGSPLQAAPAKPAPKPGPVTLTGCLQADGSRYKLTDLRGDNVPAGRSWKTGYLKKTSRQVEVVSAASGLRLKDHVGHQVTVTGMSGDGWQVKARTVKQVAGSCS